MFGKSLLAACIGFGFMISPASSFASDAAATRDGYTENRAQGSAPSWCWLEAIEIYTVPWDPEWTAAALEAASRAAVFPSSGTLVVRMDQFRKSADEFNQRCQNAGTRGRAHDAIRAALVALKEKLKAASEKRYPLTVIVCWDGIAKSTRTLTFGNGQRATAKRFAVGVPVYAEVGLSKPGDDFQGTHVTAGEVNSAKQAPSDYASFASVQSVSHDIQFGELDASSLSKPIVCPVAKSKAAGSGAVEFAIPFDLIPAQFNLMPTAPWYVEFMLYELNEVGSRAKEAKFEGSKYAVATKGGDQGRMLSAVGRLELKKPAPWGYEAELTHYFGVAPAAQLLKSASPGNPPAQADPKTEETEPLPLPPSEPSAPPSTPKDKRKPGDPIGTSGSGK